MKKRLSDYFTETFLIEKLVSENNKGFISSRNSRTLLYTVWYFYAIPSRYGSYELQYKDVFWDAVH